MIKDVLVVKFNYSYYAVVKVMDEYTGNDKVILRRCTRKSGNDDWTITIDGEVVDVQNEVYRYETKEANNQELQKFWKEYH